MKVEADREEHKENLFICGVLDYDPLVLVGFHARKLSPRQKKIRNLF